MVKRSLAAGVLTLGSGLGTGSDFCRYNDQFGSLPSIFNAANRERNVEYGIDLSSLADRISRARSNADVLFLLAASGGG